MKIGTSIIIFFLAIIALVAEFILYMLFGVGAALSDDMATLSYTALFFLLLMLLTICIGVLSPLFAVMGAVFKKRKRE